MTAFQRLYATIQEGALKHPPNRWREQTRQEHIKHALAHLHRAILQNDGDEDHLGHALARVYFAIEVTEAECDCDFDGSSTAE